MENTNSRNETVCRELMLSDKKIIEKNTPKNGALEKSIWLLTAPSFCAEIIYRTMLIP